MATVLSHRTHCASETLKAPLFCEALQVVEYISLYFLQAAVHAHKTCHFILICKGKIAIRRDILSLVVQSRPCRIEVRIVFFDPDMTPRRPCSTEIGGESAGASSLVSGI